MTTAKKDELQTKSPAAPLPKADATAPAPKDVKPETGMAPPSASIPAASVPPLIQAVNARAALDDAVTAKIVEALKQPGANMTRIANEMGVNYNVVQSIKSKLQKASGSPEQRRAPAPKPAPVAVPADDVQIQLLKLENDYLKRRLALLEGAK